MMHSCIGPDRQRVGATWRVFSYIATRIGHNLAETALESPGSPQVDPDTYNFISGLKIDNSRASVRVRQLPSRRQVNPRSMSTRLPHSESWRVLAGLVSAKPIFSGYRKAPSLRPAIRLPSSGLTDTLASRTCEISAAPIPAPIVTYRDRPATRRIAALIRRRKPPVWVGAACNARRAATSSTPPSS
jgi:hypothetical protein